MDWLVAITVVSAGAGLVEPGAAFPAETMIADELKALGSARDAEPSEIPEEDATAGEIALADLPPLHERRLAAIMAAVATLTDADFTQAGNARVAALRARLDFDPSGAEIAQGGKRPAA